SLVLWTPESHPPVYRSNWFKPKGAVTRRALTNRHIRCGSRALGASRASGYDDLTPRLARGTWAGGLLAGMGANAISIRLADQDGRLRNRSFRLQNAARGARPGAASAKHAVCAARCARDRLSVGRSAAACMDRPAAGGAGACTRRRLSAWRFRL